MNMCKMKMSCGVALEEDVVWSASRKMWYGVGLGRCGSGGIKCPWRRSSPRPLSPTLYMMQVIHKTMGAMASLTF